MKNQWNCTHFHEQRTIEISIETRDAKEKEKNIIFSIRKQVTFNWKEKKH